MGILREYQDFAKMSLFNIPTRTSSKRKCVEYTQEDDYQKLKLEIEIKSDAKRIKAAGSFDHFYWCQRGELSEKQLAHSKLYKKQSINHFLKSGDGDEEDWKGTKQAQKIHEEESAIELQIRLFKRQSERTFVKLGNDQKGFRRYFMQHITTSKKGLGVWSDDAGKGQRDFSVQSNFANKVQQACKGDMYPNDPNCDDFWCPVMGVWFPPKQMHAAHIFPWSQRQDDMDQIFGREDLNRPELFEVENGTMLSIIAEEHLEAGRIVMVPFVSDEASKEEIDAWDQSERKIYKIRVVDTKDQEMKMYTPFIKEGNRKETYNEFLEGKEIQFSSDHKPRARYLYWQYCIFMLKHSSHKDLKKGDTIKKELRKRYWGTKGAFMEKKCSLHSWKKWGMNRLPFRSCGTR